MLYEAASSDTHLKHHSLSAIFEQQENGDFLMNDRQLFGAFLKEKRNARLVTVRAIAKMVDVGCGYYSDIESGRRCRIEIGFLDKIIKVLSISDNDSKTLYDLAGKAKKAAPPDLTDYINNTPKVRFALRVAKETATDEDWDYFTRYLELKEQPDD